MLGVAECRAKPVQLDQATQGARQRALPGLCWTEALASPDRSSLMLSARPLRAIKAAIGSAVALLVLASGAQGAIVDAGSAADPAGDLGLEAGDGLPSPRRDFTNVSVRHDPAAGRLDVSITFDQ